MVKPLMPLAPFKIARTALLATLCAAPLTALAQNTATLDVDVSRRGPTIPPLFGGLMTEEINHSYDGGLFAELVQNRTFQDPQPRRPPGTPGPALPVHWSVVGNGTASVDSADPVNKALPVSLRLDLSGGAAGVANDGYWGIPVKPDTTYTASFYAKAGDGYNGKVTASLLTDDGSVTVAKADTKPLSGSWQKYTVKFKTDRSAPTTSKARFVLSATGSGKVWFSMVSLFPPTYKNTASGLRPDLMQLMADLQPAFIRLPGGNYLEGGSFPTRFKWKEMIGPADQRPGHMGCWGYRSSDGFGLPEYLLWCKQLNAEPILGVFAGYVLNGDHVDAGSPEMAQYTQEALDEIEYVMGPATSEWGKKRAADGFPEPFTLQYVEIGNEDWFDKSGSYDGRFTQIAKAIRAKYPQLKIIATAPVKSFTPDLYDDHFYRSASVLAKQAKQYDKPSGAPRPLSFNGGAWNGRQPDGIKTFVGEWATQEGRPTPNLNAALADAAFIMGLERNADTVPMECYAPLLVNVNPEDRAKGYPRAWQWGTNLIGYDALGSFGSPSYYAQSMLAKNRGDVSIAADLTMAPVAPLAQLAPRGGVGVGAWHSQVEYADVTATGQDGKAFVTRDNTQGLTGWQTAGGRWEEKENTIRPVNGDGESWVFKADPTATDYTIRLRARKLAGREGFVVLFHTKDGNNYRWWNVGGWNNTQARLEASVNGDRQAYGQGTPFTVETGRWYDLRLEVAGNRVRGYVDDKLVTEANETPSIASVPLIASATYAGKDKAVIVKVVNTGSEPVETTVNLRGVGKINPKATAMVLSGEPDGVNTLEQPRAIAPKTETLTNASSALRRTFPPHSLTILRLTTAP